MKQSQLTYEGYELDGRDLIIFYFEKGIDHCLDFTLLDFIPADYNISVRNGSEEYGIPDYDYKDWFDYNVSENDLLELVKVFEYGVGGNPINPLNY